MDIKTSKLKGNYKLYTAKRLNAGLTNADVAHITGISEAMMSYWKSGKRTPKLDSLSKIAAALGCDVSELISYEDDDDAPVNFVKPPIDFMVNVDRQEPTFTLEHKPNNQADDQVKRLLTYYRLMTSRDKSLLLDMAKRMAIVDDKEEGDPDEEP